MKLLKALLLTLSAVLLTGCYTQLQYTKSASQGRYYEDQAEEEYYEEDYIPVEYKDYAYAERYDECACNPYNINLNFYGSSYYPHSFYNGFYGSYYSPYFSSHYWSMSPHWRWRMGFGFGYPSSFAFSFGWGRPFY